MKKFILTLLILGAVLSLASCKMSGPSVVSPDGNTYEMITAEDGGRALDENGNLIVAKEDENGNEVTEVLTDKYLIVDDEKIMAPAYDMEVPDKFNVDSTQAADPRLVSKDGNIQFHVMDKTELVKNYDDYVSDSYRSLQSISADTSELEDVTIENTAMKRFYGTIPNDDGQPMTLYTYLTQANNRILLITLTAVDGEISSPEAADQFVAENVDFVNA